MGAIFSKPSSEKNGSGHQASVPASRTGSLLRVTLKRSGSRTGTLTKKGSKKSQKSENASKEHSPQLTSVTADSEAAKDLQAAVQKQPKTPEIRRQAGDTSLQEDWENLTASTAGIEAAAPVAIPESDADNGLLSLSSKVQAAVVEPVSVISQVAESESPQQMVPGATGSAVEPQTAIKEFVDKSISEATTRNEMELVLGEKAQPVVETESTMEVTPEAEVKPESEETGLVQHDDEFTVLQKTSQDLEDSASGVGIAGLSGGTESIPSEVPEVESTKELESENLDLPSDTTEVPVDKETAIKTETQALQPETEAICDKPGSEHQQAPDDLGKELVLPEIVDNTAAEVELPSEQGQALPCGTSPASDSTPVETELRLEADNVSSQLKEGNSDMQPIFEGHNENSVDEATMDTSIPDTPIKTVMQTQEHSEPEVPSASDDPCKAPPNTETTETQSAPEPAEEQSVAVEQQPTEVEKEEAHALADSFGTGSHQESETLDLAQTHEVNTNLADAVATVPDVMEIAAADPAWISLEAPSEEQSVAVEQQPTKVVGEEAQELADPCGTESHQESETLDLAQTHEVNANLEGADAIATEVIEAELKDNEGVDQPVEETLGDQNQEVESFHGDASYEPPKEEGQIPEGREPEVIPEDQHVQQTDENSLCVDDNDALSDQNKAISEGVKGEMVDNHEVTDHFPEESQGTVEDVGSVQVDQPSSESVLKSAFEEHPAFGETCLEDEKLPATDVRIGDEGSCLTTDEAQDHVTDLKAACERDLLPLEETNGFHKTPAEVEAR